MTRTSEQVEAAAAAISAAWPTRPQVGIVLGSGLGKVAERLTAQARLEYDAIPHLSSTTAPGHRGRVVCGFLQGVPVVALEGRCHGYEGHTAVQTAFPVRVLDALGIELLILSSACGGMNPNYCAGDIVVVEDHINLSWDNPLKGPHDAHTAAIPDLSCPYDRRLIDRALAIARRGGFAAHRGVYVGVPGPSYETRAEYRFLRRVGADAVGMSTVSEAIVAAQCGLPLVALSVVTNVCLPDCLTPTAGDEVVSVAERAEAKVFALIAGLIEQHAGERKSSAALPTAKRPPRTRS
jgi:purine-nucleoside phosphorylase